MDLRVRSSTRKFWVMSIIMVGSDPGLENADYNSFSLNARRSTVILLWRPLLHHRAPAGIFVEFLD